MSVYATEFPASLKTKAEFIAEISAWIKGINSANLFSEDTLIEHQGNEALVIGANEELSVREVPLSDGDAYAARYEIKDEGYRLWRVDVVYTRKPEGSAVRVKAQCVALDNRAHIATPKKPHIIKQMLDAGWGCTDGYFEVSIHPHALQQSDTSIAKKVIFGTCGSRLPIVYISRKDNGTLPLDTKKIAKELAGLAHVAVEPSRQFSRNLAKIAEHKNPYGGTVGLCVSKFGMIRKFFDPSGAEEPDQLLKRIISTVNKIASNSAPSLSLSWQDVQEISLKNARKFQENNALSAAEALYKDEISLKEETIDDLKRQIREMQDTALSAMRESTGVIQESAVSNIGYELYDGEFSDRLVKFLSSIENRYDTDPRTREMLSRMAQAFSLSGGAAALHREMKFAAKSCANATDNLSPILGRLGFSLSREGKHLKATPSERLFGVDVITLSLTPSDHRTPDNAVRDIISGLRLTGLK